MSASNPKSRLSGVVKYSDMLNPKKSHGSLEKAQQEQQQYCSAWVSHAWTDDEVELLLCITLESLINKKKWEWESRRTFIGTHVKSPASKLEISVSFWFCCEIKSHKTKVTHQR